MDDPRVGEVPEGGDRGGDRRGCDERDDAEAGQVLRPGVAVGVAVGGGAPRQEEGDPERNGGEGVGHVVDRVGEQPDRAAQRRDGGLQAARDEESDEADAERPGPGPAREEGVVDGVRRVVAVLPGEPCDGASPAAVFVAVAILVVRLVAVLVAAVGFVVVAEPMVVALPTGGVARTAVLRRAHATITRRRVSSSGRAGLLAPERPAVHGTGTQVSDPTEATVPAPVRSIYPRSSWTSRNPPPRALQVS